MVWIDCLFRGGIYIEQLLPEWRERYKRWIELGADVIASHPHVPQCWEM